MRIVLWATLSFAVSAAVSVAQAPTGTEAAAAESAAAADLELAGVYLEAGKHDEARTLIEAAVTAEPGDEARRREAAAMLRRVLEAERTAAAGERARERARERVVLQEAARLNAEGNYEDAAELLREKLDSFSSPALSTAETRLIAAHPGWLQKRWSALVLNDWIGDAVVVSVVLFLGWGFVRWIVHPLVRRNRRRNRSDRWKVSAINDSSGLGAGELLLASLHRWNHAGTPESSGLLSLPRMQVQVIPVLREEPPKLDLAAALDQLPALGGIKPGAMAKALQSLRSWAVPPGAGLSGECSAANGRIVLRLTARGLDGSVFTVAGEAEATLESCRKTAESVAFEMYYLIANNVPVDEAEAADRLRRGLQRLKAYVTTGDSKALEEAEEMFSAVRRENPALEDAYLYEGVALDLLERHDEAERLFHHLAERTRRESMRRRARYNEAIAKFRKYRHDELELAISELRDLAGAEVVERFEAKDGTELGKIDPFQALSLAAWINGIAHRSIFWQALALNLPKSDDPSEVLERKRDAREKVEDWIALVERVADKLELVCSDPKYRTISDWDDTTLRQLEWAIENARGNAYLNGAFSFFKQPFIPGGSEPELRTSYLLKALASFQACELLISGVETLTNLSTVLLNLGQTEKARDYATKAISRNPNYEYAYYRLAQAWEKDEKRVKVIEVLQSFKRAPKIPGFRVLFERYSIQPEVA